MSLNSEYVLMMETRLKRWDADLHVLATRAEKAGPASRAGVTELRTSAAAARTLIDRIRFAGSSAGPQMHGAMETAWEEMRKSLEKALSDLPG